MADNSECNGDFTQEDLNGFFYTNDRRIKRMDDELVVAKLAERYPDLLERDNENLCRLAFHAMATDTKFINEVTKFLGMTAVELFAVVYRTHTFLFNSCFVAKIHKIVKRRSYGRI